jgi:hypothetical protein
VELILMLIACGFAYKGFKSWLEFRERLWAGELPSVRVRQPAKPGPGCWELEEGAESSIPPWRSNVVPYEPPAGHAPVIQHTAAAPPARRMSKWLFLSLCFLYILSPIDICPDFLPVIGQLDDVGMLILGIKRLMDK